MKLIVGLGNPGAEYQNSRHNLGFITIDYLAEQLGLTFNKIKFFAQIAEGHVHGQKLLLMKPQTFMNCSGQAVQAGIKDIIAHLSNDNKISRCKIGINHPLYGDTVNYVLGSFSEGEKELLRPAVRAAADAAVCWLEKGITAAMNEFNGSDKPDKKEGK